MQRANDQLNAKSDQIRCWWLVKTQRRLGVLMVCLLVPVSAEPGACSNPVDNVFSLSSVLPVTLRRVAVLPLATASDSSDRMQGCEALGPILNAELGKTGKFEVVPIAPEDLRGVTGRLSWTGTEQLPADFFDALQRISGCDAVLFSELSQYRAYAPLAVGWRLKLVDVRSHQVLWAADQSFDARQPQVSKELQRKQPAKWRSIFDWNQAQDGIKEAWEMDNSPRKFGEYTVSRVLATLPAR